ncbi:MAG: LssY C-terminal domain-containing protein, partial [Desulfobacteraceae bacterium]|nr:LssY C-terminal domain-containing protein [Desulfobacteraceae bacterium]
MRLKMHHLKETKISEYGRTIMAFHESLRTVAFCILSSTILWGCATFNPRPLSEVAFHERVETQTESKIRVSAAVLSAEETEAAFGLPLYKKGIQPIWLEIENNTQHRMWFLPMGLDRNYFAPFEVAYMHHSAFSKAANRRMDQYFHQHTFRSPINPGGVRSGFVFSNLELGTKSFNVEVIGEDHLVRTFTFLIPVPGLKVDHREVDWSSLYSTLDKVAFDSSEAFRKALEELPCCTTDEDGTKMADPINIVIVGDSRDVLSALLRSGWDETAATSSYDPMTKLPWEFRYQPVKLLYLFKRFQDAAFRKSRSTLNERNQ